MVILGAIDHDTPFHYGFYFLDLIGIWFYKTLMSANHPFKPTLLLDVA